MLRPTRNQTNENITEPEGALARRLTALVRAEALVVVANKICLGAYLLLSPGEQGSEGDQGAAFARAIEAMLQEAMTRARRVLEALCIGGECP